MSTNKITLKKFLSKVSKAVSKIIQETDAFKKADYGFNPQRPLFNYEQYTITTLLASGEIETLLEQLNQSAIFLTSFRSTPKIKENGITRFDYIIYHIESHLFRLTGVLDRMLLLINKALQLNLSDEQCKPGILLKTKKQKEGNQAHLIKQKSNDLFNKLIQLQSYIEQYRADRNRITHKERYSNDKFRDIEMYSVLQKTEEGLPKNVNHLAKMETDSTINEFKNELFECNKEIRKFIDSIFIEINDVFDENSGNEKPNVMQAHLQFAQCNRTSQKLQKSLQSQRINERKKKTI